MHPVVTNCAPAEANAPARIAAAVARKRPERQWGEASTPLPIVFKSYEPVIIFVFDKNIFISDTKREKTGRLSPEICGIKTYKLFHNALLIIMTYFTAFFRLSSLPGVFSTCYMALNTMKQIFLITILSLYILGCNKEKSDCPPDLPCATQTGEDTFGCYIDGEPWVAEIGLNVFDPTVHAIDAQYDERNYTMDTNNFLYVAGSRFTQTTNGFISISIRPLPSEGIIQHSQVSYLNSNGLITYIKNGSTTDAISFELDTLFEYNFEITRLDTVKNIISGKFSFTGTSPEDTIKVSDGRFDVKYDAY